MSTLLAVFETSGIIDTIFSVIGTLLYPLFSIIFVLIGGIQHVFSAFAGIDKMSYGGKAINNGNSGAEDDTGIVYYLLNHEIVRNLILSIMLLALFLIVIFTVMAFIKNVYSAKPKGWKEIIGNAIKGLANFIFLPVCCLLGVWLGNILLQAINGVTSETGATSMERKLFIACAYNANLFRCSDGYKVTWAEMEMLINNNMINEDKTFAEYYGISFKNEYTDANDYVLEKLPSDASDTAKAEFEEKKAYYADLVDKVFSETNVNLNAWGVNAKIYVTDTGTGQVNSFNTYLGVGNFYSLWQVNYLVLIVGGIFMLYVLGSLSFAMIRRLFLILTLFVVSPAVCALYPLDEGKAVGSWKSKFIEQVLSAYGAVAGLNIFFSLVPLIDKISIFEGTAWYSGWAINDIVQIFILVVGLMVVKEFISLISSFVGGEDAYAKGSGLMKSAAKEVGGKTGKFVGKTTGAFAKAKAVRDATGSGFMRSLLETAVDEGKGAIKSATGFDYDGIKKGIKDARKEGLEHPNKAEEEAVEKYNERRSNREFRAATAAAQAAISRAGRNRLTNDDMAAVLRGIQDKEAKRRVAAMFARHNNSIITGDRNYTRGTTTIDKVLEAEDKVLQEESRRQDAFGSRTDYTGAHGLATAADSDVGAFTSAADNRSVNGTTVVYNADGTTNLSQYGDEQIANLKRISEAVGASTTDINNYTNALKTNRIIKEYAEKVEKQQQALKQLKQAALNFAAGLEKLAENYNGQTKGELITQANNVKAAANATGADVASIDSAITAARNALMANIRSTNDATEIRNILDRGTRT